MNADLMITIAFCLIVLFGSLAVGMLFAQSVRDDKAKEAEANRLAGGGEPAGAIRQPRSRRAADDECGARGLRRAGDRGRRGEKQSRAARPREHRREVKGTDDRRWLPRPP
jgi:hypothetical protein